MVTNKCSMQISTFWTCSSRSYRSLWFFSPATLVHLSSQFSHTFSLFLIEYAYARFVLLNHVGIEWIFYVERGNRLWCNSYVSQLYKIHSVCLYMYEYIYVQQIYVIYNKYICDIKIIYNMYYIYIYMYTHIHVYMCTHTHNTHTYTHTRADIHYILY